MNTTLFPNWTLDDTDDTGAISEYFHNEKIPFTEATMINCLKMKRNKYEIYWAVLALRMLGTQKAIQHLKEVTTYKNLDVQGASVLTIAYLAEGSENEYLASLLLNKDFKAKWYSVVSFNHKPDGKAVPYAAEYGFKTIKSSKNKPEAGSLIVEYLARFASENELAKKIFARINKDFENLSPKEQEVFTVNFPHIFRN